MLGPSGLNTSMFAVWYDRSRHLRIFYIYHPRVLGNKITMAATAPPISEQELVKLMHGESAAERNAFFSMLRKDGQAHRLVTDEYVQRWNEDSKAARKGRQDSYMSLVNK